ncbi:MAG: hypothetical protein AAGB13_07380 [Cyanobacteria bacterium P01_F01_bin.33]
MRIIQQAEVAAIAHDTGCRNRQAIALLVIAEAMQRIIPGLDLEAAAEE